MTLHIIANDSRDMLRQIDARGLRLVSCSAGRRFTEGRAVRIAYTVTAVPR